MGGLYEILATRSQIGRFEAQSKNHFSAGGQPLAILDAIRAEYPVNRMAPNRLGGGRYLVMDLWQRSVLHAPSIP